MKRKKLILIGGGGHGKACIDVIESEGVFEIAGIVDRREKVRNKVLGYRVIASDEELPELIRDYSYFFISVGQIKSAEKRIALFRRLKRLGAKFPVIVSPRAYVSRSATIQEGTIIMHQALVNADAVIGKNCIVNTGALIEHEATIGDFCHISTRSVVNGQCRVGSGTFIGSNCTIGNNVDIPDNTIVGAGSVVIRSLRKSGTYPPSLENPAY